MLDLDTLNYKERESYQRIINQYKVKELTISDFKQNITDLLFAVVRELAEISNNEDEKNTLLKARAKNYLLMLDILTAPEVAEEQMKASLALIEKRVKEKK